MSFLCLLLYLFCTFIRPQDWVPMFFGLRLVNMLSLATLFFLVLERMATRAPIIARVPQNKFMIGFFLTIFASHMVHTYMEGLIYSFNDFIVIFILFFLTLNAINTESKYKITIWFIFAMIFVLVPQGISQMETGFGWAGQKLTFDFHRDEYRINWIGIFNDPNDLALIFVMASGIALAFIFGKTNFFIRLLFMVLMGYLFYGIYLTNSRGGLVALMVTVFFYFVRRTKKFVLGGIVGGGVAAAVFALGPSRMGIISTSEASANARVELWYGGILLLKSNPIFGVGYDMFMEDLPQTAHNSYILAAAELGMVGLFCWMGLIYSSFKGLSLIQKYDKNLETHALALQAGLVGFCAAAFFVSRTYVILPYLMFSLAGALMIISAKNHPECVFKYDKKDFQYTGLLSIGMVLLTYIVIKVGL